MDRVALTTQAEDPTEIQLNLQNTIRHAAMTAGVLLGAGNAAGGYVVTERMLEMFKSSKPGKGSGEAK